VPLRLYAMIFLSMAITMTIHPSIHPSSVHRRKAHRPGAVPFTSFLPSYRPTPPDGTPPPPSAPLNHLPFHTQIALASHDHHDRHHHTAPPPSPSARAGEGGRQTSPTHAQGLYDCMCFTRLFPQVNHGGDSQSVVACRIGGGTQNRWWQGEARRVPRGRREGGKAVKSEPCGEGRTGRADGRVLDGCVCGGVG